MQWRLFFFFKLYTQSKHTFKIAFIWSNQSNSNEAFTTTWNGCLWRDIAKATITQLQNNANDLITLVITTLNSNKMNKFTKN